MNRFWLALFLAGSTLSSATMTARADNLDGRKAIRGRALDGVPESDELRALRDFDDAAFPRPIPGQTIVPGPADVELAGAAARTTITLPDAPRAGLSTLSSSNTGASDSDKPPEWLAQLQMPDLPAHVDARVLRYLDFYKNDKRGRATMTQWLKRQGRYRVLIEDALRRHGLPQSLLYVAMIESSYDPHDKSGPGAVGLWQFMPEVSHIYGLRIDHWVDERKNPEKSTEAQMRYFKDLYERFGSWPIVLASFNAGYGAMMRSMLKYNTNDYYELCRHENGLPWETVLYVPKAFAAAIVGENRALFGYEAVQPDAPYTFDRVTVPRSTSLANIAKAAGVPVAEVISLNPELRTARTPPERWEVRVPHGAGVKLSANWPSVEESLAQVTVRFGERLDELGRAYGASARELRTLNGIDDITDVRPGLQLLVPKGRSSQAVAPTETIVVAVPNKQAQEFGKKRVYYRTLPRDKVGEIAAAFMVKQVDLLRWNHLEADAPLPLGLVLQLWVDPQFDQSKVALIDEAQVRLCTVGSDEFFELTEAKKGRVRLVHTVKAGEDLAHVAKKYGLTSADLERINRFSERSTPLTVGQKLIVYRAMTASEKLDAQKKLVPGVPELDAPELSPPPETDPSVDIVGSKLKEEALPSPSPASNATQPIASGGGGSDEHVALPRLPSTF